MVYNIPYEDSSCKKLDLQYNKKNYTLYFSKKKKIISNYNLNYSKILFLNLRMIMLRSSITGYANKDF